MIDPIDSIVKITAKVLRRLADGIEAGSSDVQAPTVVHIENFHYHGPIESTIVNGSRRWFTR